MSIEICKLGNVVHANEICPRSLTRKYLLALLMLTPVILMLIPMLPYLSTGNADIDVDLCVRIISLCSK